MVHCAGDHFVSAPGRTGETHTRTARVRRSRGGATRAAVHGAMKCRLLLILASGGMGGHRIPYRLVGGNGCLLVRSASSRDDQCVIPSRSGGGVSVAAKIAARRRRRTVCGRPGRGRSPRPASPSRAYRRRQAITIGRETPSSRAIRVLGTPSAASSKIRARCTCDAGAEVACAQRRKTARSS